MHDEGRRRFLGTTIGAGLALATGACALTGPRKPMVVDTQVHLWKDNSPDLPWEPGAKPNTPEPVTIEYWLAEMDKAGVDRVIVVPPVLTGFNNSYALEAARRYPNRYAAMGRLDLRDPKARAAVPTWMQQRGMLGIRLGLLADPKQLTDGTADWFWPAAEKAGIPIMYQAPEAGPIIARIAERHPQLILINDHMGLSLPISKAGPVRRAAAVDHVLSLAKYPNCSVKISGVTGYSGEAYPWRDLDPEIRRLFDAYGPRRCYWGSDPTQSWGRATYRERATHLEHLDFMSAADKEWVMGRAILERLNWA